MYYSFLRLKSTVDIVLLSDLDKRMQFRLSLQYSASTQPRTDRQKFGGGTPRKSDDMSIETTIGNSWPALACAQVVCEQSLNDCSNAMGNLENDRVWIGEDTVEIQKWCNYVWCPKLTLSRIAGRGPWWVPLEAASSRLQGLPWPSMCTWPGGEREDNRSNLTAHKGARARKGVGVGVGERGCRWLVSVGCPKFGTSVLGCIESDFCS